MPNRTRAGLLGGMEMIAKRAMTALVLVLVGGCTHVPRDMVAFFNTDACPKGWAAVPQDWQGRYVVVGENRGQMVGQALDAGENRVTGDHAHNVGQAFAPPNNCRVDNSCAEYKDYGFGSRPLNVGSAVARNSGETVKPGTNAPYVALKACAKG